MQITAWAGQVQMNLDQYSPWPDGLPCDLGQLRNGWPFKQALRLWAHPV